jgi:hypothetical protein
VLSGEPVHNVSTVYDALTSRYTFACPSRGETHVRLSAFRVLERLPGAAHPALFQIVFACSCGQEHPGLVSDDDLDWAPLGLGEERFLNLMTARFEAAAADFGDLAARQIRSGSWPWSFFCYPEGRARPVFPSAFFLLAPGDGWLGLAVRCPACEHVSVNLVSPEHVDLPFHNDDEVGVLPHVFEADAARMIEEFRAELDSGGFDARRLRLDESLD